MDSSEEMFWRIIREHQTKFIVEFSRRVLLRNMDKNTVVSPVCVAAATASCVNYEEVDASIKSQILKTCFGISPPSHQLYGYFSRPNDFGDHLHNHLVYSCDDGSPEIHYHRDGDVNSKSQKELSDQAVYDRCIEEVRVKKHLKQLVKAEYLCNLVFHGKLKRRVRKSDLDRNGVLQEFHLLNAGTVQSNTMASTSLEYVKRGEGCKILKLPCERKGEDARCFSLYIVLPDENVGLERLVQNMDADFVQNILVVQERSNVNWMLQSEMAVMTMMNAKDILKSMGIISPFDADFVRQAGQIYINKVYHMALVTFLFPMEEAEEEENVDEGIAVMTNPVEDFIMNRPFLFFLKEENSGVIIFVGHFVHPL